MDKNIADIKQQHLDSYRQALLDTIQNNTNVLVEDITSLIRKPPLDSMDVLRSKILDSAKKNKIVVDTNHLNTLLEDYRNHLISCCDEIKRIRYELLSKVILRKKIKDEEVFQLFKKDFTSVNKDIKNTFKNQFENSFEVLIKQYDYLFDSSVSDEIKEKMVEEITKFYHGNYRKQLLENFDIKVMVKDTTLINSVKEQSERYLFTLNHSRLFNDL